MHLEQQKKGPEKKMQNFVTVVSPEIVKFSGI